MRHVRNLATICFYGLTCLVIFCILTSQATAQDKVVVLPLIDNEATAPAPVEKTGQSTSYATGDDGDLQKGMTWSNPRLKDNLDGTVTDNLTGLIWLKNANCFGQRPWDQQIPGLGDAVSDCNGLASGSCGLSDGSSAGDWRLPNVKELQSLIDFGNYGPALPSGHPFSDVLNYYYWSSTTGAANANIAWSVHLHDGYVPYTAKSSTYYVWPVRDGN